MAWFTVDAPRLSALWTRGLGRGEKHQTQPGDRHLRTTRNTEPTHAHAQCQAGLPTQWMSLCLQESSSCRKPRLSIVHCCLLHRLAIFCRPLPWARTYCWVLPCAHVTGAFFFSSFFYSIAGWSGWLSEMWGGRGCSIPLFYGSYLSHPPKAAPSPQSSPLSPPPSPLPYSSISARPVPSSVPHCSVIFYCCTTGSTGLQICIGLKPWRAGACSRVRAT